MAVPDFQSMMLPFLKFTADGEEHNMTDVREGLAKEFNLMDEEISELLPSGRQTRFGNRVAWAKVYLSQAGLLDNPRRGVFQISERGKSVLSDPPPVIDIKYLERFPEFREFRYDRKKSKETSQVIADTTDIETPEEALEQAAQRLSNELSKQLIKQVKINSPVFLKN